MKIEKIEIKGLFGKKDICWELNPQVNVLVGENGSGKSTILSVINDILVLQVSDKNIPLFDYANIQFNDNSITEYVQITKSVSIEKMKTQNDRDNSTFNPLTLLPLLLIPVSPILAVGATSALLGIASGTKNSTNQISIENINQDAIFQTVISKVIQGKNNKDSLYTDFIEANLSNANANQKVNLRTRLGNNPLDIEIQDTIDDLNKLNNPELINRLSGSLNVFFNQIGKQVTYENNKWIYTDTQLHKTLNYSDLSSGERQLIYILLRVALSNGDKNKTAIMLMDEPEISLHLNWQEHFIKQLTILNPDAQFIIVTHSPALIMNGWNDVYVDMAEITRDMEQAQS